MAKKHPPVRKLFGHVYDWRAVDDYVATLSRPMFAVSASPLAGSGDGKTVLLHKAVMEVAGYFPIRRQTIGDCVSMGAAGAVDCLKAVEIALNKESEEWRGITATEPIYAASRVEIGGGRLSGDGSFGAWAAKAVNQYGTVIRDKFGSIDLRTYSGTKARQWGRRGVGCPDELEPHMREHLVRTVSMVRTFEEARDAIANGYPVTVASQQGFTSRRDSQGFCRASGSWPHQMYFMACRADRPGLLCMNSWGPNWVSGPKVLDQPDGSFWVDADVANRMLSRNPDSYCFSQFEGYPSQDLNYWLI